MQKATCILIGLVILAGAFWLGGILGLPWAGIGLSVLLVAAVPGSLVTLGLVRLSSQVNLNAWLVFGLAVLVGLLVPTSLLPDDYIEATLPAPFATIATVFLVSLPVLAILLAAILFYAGVQAFLKWRSAAATVTGEISPPGALRGSAVGPTLALALALLLIAKTLNNLYWLTIWDNTYDPLGYLWLVLPILAALVGGTVLSTVLAGRLKLTGLGYALVVPALLVTVSYFAQKVDFRQLTQARAATVAQAIDGYHVRHGHYPQDLAELVPFYRVSLPGPVIINGQKWCYDGGETYYRLGYVDRSHWSDPNLVGRLYRSAGNVPDQAMVCARQIEMMQTK